MCVVLDEWRPRDWTIHWTGPGLYASQATEFLGVRFINWYPVRDAEHATSLRCGPPLMLETCDDFGSVYWCCARQDDPEDGD